MRQPLSRLGALDARLSARMAFLAALPHSLALRRLHVAAIAIAHLGDGVLWIALGSLCYLLFSSERHRIVSMAAVVLGEALVVSMLKLISRRQRPARADGRGFFQTYDRYSFPSGHAARMACIALLVGVTYPGWGWALWPVAVGVALSRVLLGVHHLADVLVGGGIGALIAWVGWAALLNG